MSLQFNDTANFKGLVQTYEDEIGVPRGFVSGNTELLKNFARDANLAWDDYVTIALKASGRWQFDDSNHTDYPIIKTNLVQGQRDYTFVVDESGNLILDIYKVLILPSATATEYEEITPIDQQTQAGDITAESATQGVPRAYDKTGNGILLDKKPSYNATLGLKMLINREPSYFVYSDTSKKAGCAGIHYRYFALKPAMDYARQKSLTNYDRIRAEVVGYEGIEESGVQGSIERYYARRSRDERSKITMAKTPYI